MRIYFDVCCLHRPLDDQSQERIRLESEAVRLLLEQCGAGVHKWVSSEIVEEEVSRNPDEEQRELVIRLLRFADESVLVNDAMWSLADRLTKQGLAVMDSLHLAVAELSECDLLLTTDDALVRNVKRLKPALQIRIANPAAWLLEGTDHGA